MSDEDQPQQRSRSRNRSSAGGDEPAPEPRPKPKDEAEAGPGPGSGDQQGGGDGSGQGGRGKKSRRRNKRRRGGRRRSGTPPREEGVVGFWGDVGKLPQPQDQVRMTEDPGAVPRSLGTPPLPGHEHIAQHYFELVYDRAVMTASALAAAGGLIEPDELAELTEPEDGAG